jgi:hypothetical protein
MIMLPFEDFRRPTGAVAVLLDEAIVVSMVETWFDGGWRRWPKKKFGERSLPS